MGVVIMTYAMTVAGVAFSFIRGWSYSLIILAAFPFLGLTSFLLASTL
jgi:lipoprotein signal peptidase